MAEHLAKVIVFLTLTLKGGQVKNSSLSSGTSRGCAKVLSTSNIYLEPSTLVVWGKVLLLSIINHDPHQTTNLYL